MARKKTELGATVERRIEALAKRGGTAESIAKELKAAGVKGVSASTVSRRLREVRGRVRMKRVDAKRSSAPSSSTTTPPAPKGAPPASDEDDGDLVVPPMIDWNADDPDPPLPTNPDKIPEGLDLQRLHRLREKADKAARLALANMDLTTFAAMGRLVTALSEAIRKATPPERPNPDDSPDMRALADDVIARLHRMIDQVQ